MQDVRQHKTGGIVATLPVLCWRTSCITKIPNNMRRGDNALTSPKGPPPGYVTGGPNKDYSYTQLSPPASQPPQKSYRDVNDGWPESSWEISEPAIYYNAAYILLLFNFAQNILVLAPALPTHLLSPSIPTRQAMSFLCV